jgi:hypothetical protein
MFETVDCACDECDWRGSWDELEGEAYEDSDGDLVSADGGGLMRCPACGGPTHDIGF